MMDFSGTNRGYLFVRYSNNEEAKRAVKFLNNFEIRPGKKIFFSGEFPHLVMITRDGAIGNTIVCTGSLISEKAVVSAGHCCVRQQFVKIVKMLRLHTAGTQSQMAEKSGN